MIVFDLKCDQGHKFEAWFKSTDAFVAQQSAGHVHCPECQSTTITKALMAPAVSSSRKLDTDKPQARLQKVMGEIRRKVQENCDYVGAGFAEEARKMHYGEAPGRGIYGEASPDEVRALVDEGVDILPVPAPPKLDS